MKLERNLHVTLKDGDMELRAGKALATFSYKGVDKFVLRTEELIPLAAMLQSAKREMDEFYPIPEKKVEPPLDKPQ